MSSTEISIINEGYTQAFYKDNISIYNNVTLVKHKL